MALCLRNGLDSSNIHDYKQNKKLSRPLRHSYFISLPTFSLLSGPAGFYSFSIVFHLFKTSWIKALSLVNVGLPGCPEGQEVFSIGQRSWFNHRCDRDSGRSLAYRLVHQYRQRSAQLQRPDIIRSHPKSDLRARTGQCLNAKRYLAASSFFYLRHTYITGWYHIFIYFSSITIIN